MQSLCLGAAAPRLARLPALPPWQAGCEIRSCALLCLHHIAAHEGGERGPDTRARCVSLSQRCSSAACGSVWAGAGRWICWGGAAREAGVAAPFPFPARPPAGARGRGVRALCPPPGSRLSAAVAEQAEGAGCGFLQSLPFAPATAAASRPTPRCGAEPPASRDGSGSRARRELFKEKLMPRIG